MEDHEFVRGEGPKFMVNQAKQGPNRNVGFTENSFVKDESRDIILHVWHQKTGEGNTRVMARAFSLNNMHITKEIQISAGEAADYSQQTVILVEKTFVVTYGKFNRENGAASVILSRALQISAEDGTHSLGHEVQVNSVTNKDQNYPASAATGKNTFAVAYVSGEKGAGTSRDIFERTFRVSDLIIEPITQKEEMVNIYTYKDQYKSTIVRLTDDIVVIVFESCCTHEKALGLPSGSGDAVFGRLYDVLGDGSLSPRTEEFVLSSHFEYSQQHPSVMTLNEEYWIAMYDSHQADFKGEYAKEYGAYMQVFDMDGNKVGKEVLINTHVQGAQWTPKGIKATEDLILIVFVSSGDIHMQPFSWPAMHAGPQKLGPELKFSNSSTRPDLVSLGSDDGTVLMAWTEYEGDNSIRYAQKLKIGKKSPGPPESIFSDASQDTPPSSALGPGSIAAILLSVIIALIAAVVIYLRRPPGSSDIDVLKSQLVELQKKSQRSESLHKGQDEEIKKLQGEIKKLQEKLDEENAKLEPDYVNMEPREPVEGIYGIIRNEGASTTNA